MTAKKLNEQEFEHAIKLGLGRAVLHVRDYGDEGMEDILERAMLTSHIFDRMFESCRSWWIFEILCTSGNLSRYADYLLANLSLTTDKMLNIEQKLVLASLFYEHGFKLFRPQVLKLGKALLGSKNSQITVANQLINLFGLAGFEIAVSEMVKAGIDVERDSYECNAIFERAVDEFDDSAVEKSLNSLLAKEESVNRFRESVESFRDDSEKPSSVMELTLQQILELFEFQSKGLINIAYRRYGRKASTSELAAVFEALTNTEDWQKQNAYLDVFADRELPELDDKIMSLIHSEHEVVRRSLFNTLSNTTDERLRTKALELLDEERDDCIQGGLRLLRKNYRPEDAGVILKALKKLKDGDYIHWAGMDVEAIADVAGRTELNDCFEWLYENGPDSYCRRRFVKQLMEWNCAPSHMLFEAQWDVSDDVRNLVRDHLARKDVFASSQTS